MNKLIKLFIFLDFALLIFILAQWFFLELSSTILYVSIGAFAGIVFFILFLGFVLLLKTLFRPKSNEKPSKIGGFSFLLGLILSILVAIIVFNYSLYFQALLGNDLFVTLDLNQDNFNVTNGESFSLEAESAIITNPFCSANCNLTLTDLSTQEVISFDTMHVLVSNPYSREYNLVLDESTYGQKFYKVDLMCTSQEGLFCYTTTNSTKHASKIASVTHSFNEEQSKSLGLAVREISSLDSRQKLLASNLNLLALLIQENSSLNLSSFGSSVSSLITQVQKENIVEVLSFYYNQDFSGLEENINHKDRAISILENKFQEVNKSILLNLSEYNSFVEDINLFYNQLAEVSSSGLDNSSADALDNLILDFNNDVLVFSKDGDLEFKKSAYTSISSLVEGFDFSNLSNGSFYTKNFPLNVTLDKIFLNYSDSVEGLNLSSPNPLCCFSGVCSVCLSTNSSINYPVIFLHGHSFNEKVSAIASLETFSPIQERLESDGYFNAGSFFYSGYEDYSYGAFGGINAPISIRASYYFDVFSSDSGVSLLETKTNNIDTYAIRLKEIVEDIKYITGKDKVVLVTHSMGGLVARRYIQVFGSENIDRLIMITSPNHGVDGFVVDYCTLFGTADECNDMSSDSLFLNKLNQQTSMDIPVYNIIGDGCYWEDSNGDGIVKDGSAYLSFAKNFYVNGTCDGFNYFHSNVLDYWKYPEVYDLMKESLLANNSFD